MMHAVDRGTDVVGAVVERHLGAVVAASTAAIGATLGVIDGWSVETVTTAGICGFVLAIVSLVVRVLLTDIRQLRARVRELETRADGERQRLIDRIDELERRLGEDDDGR